MYNSDNSESDNKVFQIQIDIMTSYRGIYCAFRSNPSPPAPTFFAGFFFYLIFLFYLSANGRGGGGSEGPSAKTLSYDPKRCIFKAFYHVFFNANFHLSSFYLFFLFLHFSYFPPTTTTIVSCIIYTPAL